MMSGVWCGHSPTDCIRPILQSSFFGPPDMSVDWEINNSADPRARYVTWFPSPGGGFLPAATLPIDCENP